MHHGLVDLVEGEDRENDKLARGPKNLMAFGPQWSQVRGIR
jgi:hypothetical protein